MGDQQFAALIAALVLAAIHVLGGRLRFLEGVPRSRWLSAFAGVSVAYVFAHLLPELAQGQETIEGRTGEGEADEPILGFLEHHVYLASLLGLAVFYGVEKHSLASRRERVALAVHFLINDFGLREHHGAGYERVGRWLIAAAVLIGWMLGVATEISERATSRSSSPSSAAG